MDDDVFLALWRRARDQEFGICIQGEPNRVIEQRLYEVRKGHLDLMDLQICRMANGELWIVKKSVDVLDATRS